MSIKPLVRLSLKANDTVPHHQRARSSSPAMILQSNRGERGPYGAITARRQWAGHIFPHHRASALRRKPPPRPRSHMERRLTPARALRTGRFLPPLHGIGGVRRPSGFGQGHAIPKNRSHRNTKRLGLHCRVQASSREEI